MEEQETHKHKKFLLETRVISQSSERNTKKKKRNEPVPGAKVPSEFELFSISCD